MVDLNGGIQIATSDNPSPNKCRKNANTNCAATPPSRPLVGVKVRQEHLLHSNRHGGRHEGGKQAPNQRAEELLHHQSTTRNRNLLAKNVHNGPRFCSFLWKR